MNLDGKAALNEIELFDYFTNIEDLIDIDANELALNIILPKLIQYSKYKDENPSQPGTSISIVKYHHPQLLGSQKFKFEDRIKQSIDEAFSYLINNGYIIIQNGRDIESGYITITRSGNKIGIKNDPSSYKKFNDYPWEMIHPEIRKKAQQNFRQGEYTNSVKESFQRIETYMKEIVSLAGDKIRINDLINMLFKENSNILQMKTQDPNLQSKEREALKKILEGSITLYLNPVKHSEVTIEINNAFHQIMFASLLMHEIDERRTVQNV